MLLGLRTKYFGFQDNVCEVGVVTSLVTSLDDRGKRSTDDWRHVQVIAFVRDVVHRSRVESAIWDGQDEVVLSSLGLEKVRKVNAAFDYGLERSDSRFVIFSISELAK